MTNDVQNNSENGNSWMSANRMKLNISKSKMCIFATKSTIAKVDLANHPLALNSVNNCITHESDIWCWGLILNQQLTREQHINILGFKLQYNSTIFGTETSPYTRLFCILFSRLLHVPVFDRSPSCGSQTTHATKSL